MNKYTKIVPFDVGTERPTEEYVRKLEAVVEVAKELNEVAYHRGDNILPHPSDDPKLWSARMQDAWDELERTLTDLENLTTPAK